ncbi:hypothetical protein J5N97_026236 [Dioscorea zingiberensis]|uniref:DNA primase n=1 Tax=Dioscorea zingiberensis TaxID=325984 RepID=A0A9D5C2Y2_9LILI|nr:hypothetical protein J5N97_026236 [Dioscorea zingiberensis]
MEEKLDGGDDMQIDGCDSELQRTSKVPQGFNADYLKVYYGKLFPCADMLKWMSYGNACDPSFVGQREFSFTLENDIYLRYLSFNSVTEFENSIKKECPFKIDIGPVYSVDVRHAYAQGGGFTPVERELIFDIDMSDYDDVQYCCSGVDVCSACWPLMTIAIKVIDTTLRDDFGFNHILWVYSGRRGVHCWVINLQKYFHVYKGSENGLKNIYLVGPVLHPFLASYTDVLRVHFEEKLLCDQKLLASEDRYQKILELIPYKSIADELHGKWQGNRRSSNAKEDLNVIRWEQLKHALQRCVEEIVFLYTYPKLDIEVSKHMNHLLKAPFCVHPKTGRVCVPIDPTHCDEFDPSTVPTLSGLLEKLNMSGAKSESLNGHQVSSCSSANKKQAEAESSKMAEAITKHNELQSMQIDLDKQDETHVDNKAIEAKTLTPEENENQFDWVVAGLRRGRGRGRGPSNSFRNPEATPKLDTWQRDQPGRADVASPPGMRSVRGGRGGHLSQRSSLPRDKGTYDPIVALTEENFPPITNPSRDLVIHSPSLPNKQPILAVEERRFDKTPNLPLPPPEEVWEPDPMENSKVSMLAYLCLDSSPPKILSQDTRKLTIIPSLEEIAGQDLTIV